MKKLSLKLLLCCFIAILLFSCSGNDTSFTDGDSFENEQFADGDEDDYEIQEAESELADGDLDGEVLEESSEEESEAALEPFYFSVLSDTHIYITDENNNKVLKKAGELFSAYDPAIDFGVVTGDVVHDLFCIEGMNCEPTEVLKTYRDIIDNYFSIPLYTVLGNHDNRFFDSFGGNDFPLSLWLKALEGSGSLPAPYYRIKHKGFNFVMMFASDMATDHDSNDECNFGEEQLSWLENILDEGLPSVIFWHQLVWPNEDKYKDNPVLPIIKNHKDIVKAVFFGHGHNFRKVVWEGVPFLETGACSGKEEPVYHLVRVDPLAKTLEVANQNEIEYVD